MFSFFQSPDQGTDNTLEAIDPDFQLRLQDWLDGRMSADERSAFQRELASSSEKAAFAEKLSSMNEDLRNLRKELVDEEIPANLLNVVRQIKTVSADDGGSGSNT